MIDKAEEIAGLAGNDVESLLPGNDVESVMPGLDRASFPCALQHLTS